MNIIETQNLTKSYADFTAVSNVNLHIPKGAVYGFLGPNGAGKSTTMKMFLGLTKPTSGSFTIDGKKYPEARVEILKEVGSFIEAPAFYGNLSGEENLEIVRKILGLPKSSVSEALEIVGLTQFRRRRFLLYYEYDYNYSEIGAMEHCNSTAVYQSIVRAREKIKTQMKNYLCA